MRAVLLGQIEILKRLMLRLMLAVTGLTLNGTNAFSILEIAVFVAFFAYGENSLQNGSRVLGITMIVLGTTIIVAVDLWYRKRLRQILDDSSHLFSEFTGGSMLWIPMWIFIPLLLVVMLLSYHGENHR
jgi:hypothetical protein